MSHSRWSNIVVDADAHMTAGENCHLRNSCVHLCELHVGVIETANSLRRQDNIRRRPLHGFTLVELLVVIAIIGILIALLLPAVQAAREAARRSQCLNNAKQIGLALHNYHSARRIFPPGETELPNQVPGHAWSAYILPYLEETSTFAGLDFNQSGYPASASLWAQLTVNHYRALATPISVYHCPSSGHAPTFNFDGHPIAGLLPPNSGPTPFALTNATGILEYQGIAGSNRLTNPSFDSLSNLGILFQKSGIRFRDVIDGTSKTMIVGEYSHLTQYQQFNAYDGTGDSDGTWDTAGWPGFSFATKTIAFAPFSPAFWPTANTYTSSKVISTISRAALKSGHSGGIHVAMADGSARFVSSAIDLITFKNLADRADGLAVGGF